MLGPFKDSREDQREIMLASQRINLRRGGCTESKVTSYHHVPIQSKSIVDISDISIYTYRPWGTYILWIAVLHLVYTIVGLRKQYCISVTYKGYLYTGHQIHISDQLINTSSTWKKNLRKMHLHLTILIPMRSGEKLQPSTLQLGLPFCCTSISQTCAQLEVFGLVNFSQNPNWPAPRTT